MRQTITPGDTPENWDAEALYLKATRYAQQMAAVDSESWEHALWSSLSLELLARAALANVSPALLAECDKSSSSLLHSLGYTPKEERFVPKSIAMTEVLKRLGGLFDSFTREHESFCQTHTNRRNSELHSGQAAFEGVAGSSWQAKFYAAVTVLLGSMEVALEEFVGSDQANMARKLIEAASDESAKAVRGEIEAHSKVWFAREETERVSLATSAQVWATRETGHRVSCPACKSVALVNGEPISAAVHTLSDDEITEVQEFLPSRFQCVACGLKILGLSRLSVAGVADRYKKTVVYEASQFYAPDDEHSGFDEDNNER